MPMRLTRSGPPAPTSPTIKFTRQAEVLTLARLIAEHRGKHRDRDYFKGLIYSCLIYDHYAAAYQASFDGHAGIGQSWIDLANTSEVQAAFAKILPWSVVVPLKTLTLDLPITSASALFPRSAPQGKAPGQYAVGTLSSAEFAEIAWKVRCNLLHGSWNPCDRATSLLISKVGRVCMTLVWEMLCQTQR